MNSARLDFLFQRFLNGTTTPEEEQELIGYLSHHDDPQVKKLMEEVWNKPVEKMPAEKAASIVNSILCKQEKVVFHDRRNYAWAKAAAITAFIALTGIAFYKFNKPVTSNVLTSYSVERLQQKQRITLPDGSTVMLNNSSTLEYADSFDNKDAREVYLKGEAFFDIVHDSTKPFIVHTDKISTTVLGTAFNVKAYPNENDITVTVTRGKVRVSDAEQVLGIITPDEQITFHRDSQQANQKTVKSKEVTTWAEKDIEFDDVSVAEAVKQLEEHFEIKIKFTNENLKDCRFTATFIKGEDLYQILDVICAFNRATYELNPAGEIEISGAGCSIRN